MNILIPIQYSERERERENPETFLNVPMDGEGT